MPFQILNAVFQNIILVPGFLLASTAYRSIMDWFHHEKVNRNLENQNLRSELLFLKSQINPHLLLNTLSNIYVLAYQGSAKTADSVLKLSEMMQYLLYETGEPKIPLNKEILSMQRFIDLQSLGFKEEPALQFTIQGNNENYEIAPLLLIAFAENIFKHGILSDKKDPAILSLTMEKRTLYFYSRNRISEHTKDSTKGIGLSNVARRLTLLYPARHALTINKGPEYFEVHLKLEL